MELAPYWEAVRAQCVQSGVALEKHEPERGREQHEVALSPQRDAHEAVRQANAVKRILAEAAEAHGMQADFAAMPFTDRPGSGLHVHVHMEDRQGQNVFFKRDDEISTPLQHAIGGLLATLPEAMVVFAPHESSYARFQPGGTAPTTISWGANNRTVAIRLPDIGAPHRHIEHRVAGADAETGRVIAAVLAGMLCGLHEQSQPGAQIYGDASLAMYALAALPQSLAEARRCAAQSGLLVRYGFAALMQGG